MKTLNAKLKLTDNPILNTDSYKISHWMFLEDNTSFSTSYIESRQGSAFPETVFFGLQYILEETDFLTPITAEMVDQAERVLTAHGEPFNRAGWDHIVNEHNGYLPVRIRAVKEGSVVPIGNALIVVESTDPRFNSAWVASFVETKLMRIWYPTTVATISREIKKVITASLERTGDPALADMKLVDFGSRGVSSKEQAMIGGAAHLVNFVTTDNLLGVAMSMEAYGDGEDSELTGFSIPATEHSVTTSWGKPHEFDFVKNIVHNVLPKTGICSVVGDTYDLMGFLDMLGELREEIEKNGVIVARPDSGDPVEMTEATIIKLDELFGSRVNEKGFKVLNDCVRIIQGDGIDLEMVGLILDNFERLGYSADNITFGSGGGLLQKLDRDTMRFAMKASNVIVGNESRDIQKVPLTDPTKSSKKGRLMLVRNTETGAYRTVNQHDEVYDNEIDALDVVFENGKVLRRQTFAEIRALAV